MAQPLLDGLPGVRLWAEGDKGLAAQSILGHGVRLAFWPRAMENRSLVIDRAHMYPNLVEQLWNGLKECLAMATRYEKTA